MCVLKSAKRLCVGMYNFRYLQDDPTGAEIKCVSRRSIENLDLPCIVEHHEEKIIFNFTFKMIMDFKIIKLTFCVFYSRKLL